MTQQDLPAPRRGLDDNHDAAASHRARVLARVHQLRYAANHIMAMTVLGPRGHSMTVGEAQHRADMISDQIDIDRLRGDGRHHRVATSVKVLMLVTLALVDFPIMLWLTSSALAVDWAGPVGLPLVMSVLISALATGVFSAALYHLGHAKRAYKNRHRQLDWRGLSRSSKVCLSGVTLLVLLTSVVMFEQVYTEGALTFLLATLVAIVMVASAELVFWTAFRDGSAEQDELVHYTRVVRDFLAQKQKYEQEANELMFRLAPEPHSEDMAT